MAVVVIILIAQPSNVNVPNAFAVKIVKLVLMVAPMIHAEMVALVLAVQMAQCANAHRDTKENIVKCSIISVR